VFGWLIVSTIFTAVAWLFHLSLCCPFKKRKESIQNQIMKDIKKGNDYEKVPKN